MSSQPHPFSQLVGEQSIPAQMDSLFLLGSLIAELNAQGLVVENISQSAYFSPDYGKWLIKREDLVKSVITVEKIAKQFYGLTNEIDEFMQHAIVNGYAQKSSYLIDPRYPDFTNILLTQLNTHFIHTPKNQHLEIFNVENILSKYGLSISYKERKAFLVTSPRNGGERKIKEEYILLTTIVLLFAHVDIKPWIEHGEKTDPTSSSFKILGALLRKDYTKEAPITGLIPRLLGIKGPKDHLFNLLIKQSSNERKLYELIGIVLENNSQTSYIDNVEEATQLLQSIKSVFKIGTQSVDAEKLHFLETLSDGLANLALTIQTTGNSLASIYLAQSSKNILQWVASNWDDVETRLNKAEFYENQFKWRKLSQIKEMDRYTFYNTCTYANTATLTDLIYFKRSRELFKEGKVSNHLWSAIYRAIERQRWILHYIAASMDELLQSKEDIQHVNKILTLNLKQLQSALVQHMRAAQVTFEKHVTSSLAQCWLTPEQEQAFLLQKELDIVTLLLDSINGKGLSTHSLNLFQQLLGLSGSIKDVSKYMDISILSDQDITTLVQEDHSYQENQHHIINEFNELVNRYHAKEPNLLMHFQTILVKAKDETIQQCCMLIICLLAIKSEEWELALQMATFLHDLIPSAWDLPSIPYQYLGNGISEQSLSIDPILDALRLLSEHYPAEQTVHHLIDRYLERYAVE